MLRFMWISKRYSFRLSRPRKTGKGRLNLPLLAGMAAMLCFAAGNVLAAIGQYNVQKIKPNVFAWVSDDVLSEAGDPLFNRPGNAGFVITPQGVVVIDSTNSPFNARDVLFEIRQRTDLPVRYVINTSGNPDLTLGNEVFEDFKPTILSTPQAQAWFELYIKNLPARLDGDWRLARAMRGIHPTIPTATFNSKTNLSGVNMKIQMIPLGANDTVGDAAVFLPQAKVVFLGDLFNNGYFPWIGRGDVRHWIQTLREVESWNADVYVPGHGEPGTKADVAAFRKFLEWLTGAVEARIKKGEPIEQVEKELLPFQNYKWHASELQQEALDEVYSQLAPAKAAKPAASAPAPATNP